MSIRLKALKHIEDTLEFENLDIKGLRMCMMGLLSTKTETRDYLRKKNIKPYGRIHHYWKYLGADIVALDLNTCDQAMPIDLGMLIKDDKLLGTFDVVIDGGTGEHIDNQYEYFSNMFNLLRVGGIAICFLPHEGCWKEHARWRYTFDWFIGLAKRSNILITDLRKMCDIYGKVDLTRMCVVCTMKKTQDTRIDKDSFIDPIFDPIGCQHDDRRYQKFIIPARSNETPICA